MTVLRTYTGEHWSLEVLGDGLVDRVSGRLQLDAYCWGCKTYQHAVSTCAGPAFAMLCRLLSEPDPITAEVQNDTEALGYLAEWERGHLSPIVWSGDLPRDVISWRCTRCKMRAEGVPFT